MKTVTSDGYGIHVVGSLDDYRRRVRKQNRAGRPEGEGSVTPREEYRPHVSRQVHASVSASLGRTRPPTMSEAFA